MSGTDLNIVSIASVVLSVVRLPPCTSCWQHFLLVLHGLGIDRLPSWRRYARPSLYRSVG